MTEPADRRHFDDEEVALILRRASELQAQRGPDGGMTLAELEDAAREAGLDPALVRRAAAELPTRDEPAAAPVAGGGWLGAPTVLRFERVVDGELPASEYDVLVDEIRRTMNDVGALSTLGRSLAWGSTPSGRRGQAAGRAVSVTVTARGGRTTIRVEEGAGGLAGGLFGGIVGGVGGGGVGIATAVGVAVLHSALAALGIWAALAGSSYLLARGIFSTVVDRRAAQLSALADRLAALAAETKQGS